MITTKEIVYTLAMATLVLAAAMYFAFVFGHKPIANGSVARSGEYSATSTRNAAGVAMPGELVLSATTTNSGTLGSVVITGAGAGALNFYDATTSNVNLRAASMSTSSILITTIPASAAAQTYTFDVSYVNGLLLDISGTAPTSTITYRFN